MLLMYMCLPVGIASVVGGAVINSVIVGGAVINSVVVGGAVINSVVGGGAVVTGNPVVVAIIYRWH